MEVSATGIVNAPKSVLWELLADEFADMADWSAGITKSEVTSKGAIGLNTERRCELSNGGVVEETIREFKPQDRLTVSIDRTQGVPIKSSITTFTLVEKSADTTELTIEAKLESKLPSFIANLLAPVRKPRLTKAFASMIEEADVAARKRIK